MKHILLLLGIILTTGAAALWATSGQFNPPLLLARCGYGGYRGYGGHGGYGWYPGFSFGIGFGAPFGYGNPFYYSPFRYW